MLLRQSWPVSRSQSLQSIQRAVKRHIKTYSSIGKLSCIWKSVNKDNPNT